MKLPPDITTVLFDMDGVLIDTSVAVHDAYTDWAVANDLDPEVVLAGVHGRRTVEVAAAFGFEDVEAEADRVEKAIADRARSEHGIEPVCALYRSLERGRFAVATSARRETALTNLRVLELEPPEVLVTGQDVENGKPEPDPYILAARRLGVPTGQCVVIEDAPAGIEAGKAAGCLVLALLTNHDRDELAAADMVLAPDDLADVFRKLTD